MKFQVALLSLLAASAQAFTPTPFVPQALINNGAAPTTTSSSSDKLWKPPMNMVAGGAEQSQSDYYEGAFLSRKHGTVFTQNFACLTQPYSVKSYFSINPTTYRCSYWTPSGSSFSFASQPNCLYWYAFSSRRDRIDHCRTFVPELRKYDRSYYYVH